VTLPALRYLSAADVTAALPSLDERLKLAEKTLIALADDSAELPPKIGIHPRAPSSFGQAMPAHLRGADPDGADDLVGMKWVVGYPGNEGLPTIFATVILNDAATGVPLAILEGGPITAARTAAISGVAIHRFAPEPGGAHRSEANAGANEQRARGHRVALIGAGVQGRSHVEIVGHVLPGAALTIFDRHPAHAEALATMARATAGIARAQVARDPREATMDADVVITAASFGPVNQVMTDDWLTPHALVVPVDYATYCSASIAHDASLFVVDEIGQFLAARAAGLFAGYPDPTTTIGAAILDATRRPNGGRVVATHLGTGLADLVFGRAIMRRAIAADLGTVIPR
jgi:ornithine cyclodeaminase/alanine dehydrogenase-like protein (mu-crystallin family)